MIRFTVRRRSRTPATWGGGVLPPPVTNNLDGGYAATVLFSRTVDNGYASTVVFTNTFNGGGA